MESLRITAQNEMLLSEESAPAAVLDELQQLQAQLQGHAEELARLNKFQRLFKVPCPVVCLCVSATDLLGIVPCQPRSHNTYVDGFAMIVPLA